MSKINYDYDIGKAFAAIEEELISSMIRNMKRHKVEEAREDKQWSMWQAEQLKALERYKTRNRKKFHNDFVHINKKIGELIRQANLEGGMGQEKTILQAIKKGFKVRGRNPSGPGGGTGEFFKLNQRKLEALIRATTSDMQRAETAVLRMANDQYRRVIFNAQVYANSGAGTYEKAVDMATKDFLSAGLNCIEYKDGSRHTLADYADMAIRTASKRAYLQGEGVKRQEWGISTVIMNKRGNPCPKCLPFVGKILIDDVWSGGRASDGNYPLMSSAIAAGLYHPRCKDSHTTYFEGISTPPDAKYTEQEIANIEEHTKQEVNQKYSERQSEKFNRLAKYSLDSDNKRQYRERAKAWNKKATKRFVSHEELEKYIKEQYNGTINKDVKALDIRQVGMTLSELEAVLSDFSIAKHFFKGINTCKMGKAAFVPNGELALNEDRYTRTNDSLVGVGYHEAGHLLELTLIRAENPTLLDNDVYRIYAEGTYAREVVKEAFRRIKTKRTLKELRAEISNYSLKDCSETLAEAVADYYMNGYGASVLSRQIMKVLEERL